MGIVNSPFGKKERLSMWQEVIVGLCVITAAAFLARRWLPFFVSKNTSACGGCGGCDTAKSCANPAEKGLH